MVNGALHVRRSNLANQCPHASLSFSILGAFLRHGPINHGLPRAPSSGGNQPSTNTSRRRLAVDSMPVIVPGPSTREFNLHHATVRRVRQSRSVSAGETVEFANLANWLSHHSSRLKSLPECGMTLFQRPGEVVAIDTPALVEVALRRAVGCDARVSRRSPRRCATGSVC
jgi:hypothetical protein